LDALFANHLHFMATHRGSVSFCGRDVQTDGPLPGLASFIPGTDESVAPQDCLIVHLTPWSGLTWPERLRGEGFRPVGSLSYMELANPYVTLAANESADIRLATTEELARDFAAIQYAGFAENDAKIDEQWRKYFLEQALRNYRDPDQRFYIGWRENEAVTSTLVVRCFGVWGIYAVATRPQHRNKGMGIAVLERIRRDALEAGATRLILQAFAGSYAEGYYARRGFWSRFQSQLWRRAS
jgi:GNAT superfamily N-acetyltransferase